jgi:hypothetical protein
MPPVKTRPIDASAQQSPSPHHVVGDPERLGVGGVDQVGGEGVVGDELGGVPAAAGVEGVLLTARVVEREDRW